MDASPHLAAALAVPTVSRRDEPTDLPAFAALHEVLSRAFPRAHAAARPEIVAGASLLFTWMGAIPGEAPLVLLAHQDVVPADDPAAWTHPPFGGVVADGAIWGRGALDFKCGLVGQLAAVEHLLADGFAPRRTVILAHGHDEEIGGARGAASLAAILRSREVRPAFVLDEGLSIVRGVVSGVDVPLALIGVAEKGWVNVELVARGVGGHAASPPRETAPGILARAVTRVEAHPMPLRLTEPADRLLAGLSEVARPPLRVALRMRRWLAPVVLRRLAANPSTNSVVRTTTAVTVLRAGQMANVLPTEARAIVNARLLPGDAPEDVVRHLEAVIDDERVAVRPLTPLVPPPRPSPGEGPVMDLLRACVEEVAPDAHVVPAMVLGSTDSRHYTGLTDRVYRFAPQRMDETTLGLVHGVDERIGQDTFARMVDFYAAVITHADTARL